MKDTDLYTQVRQDGLTEEQVHLITVIKKRGRHKNRKRKVRRKHPAPRQETFKIKFGADKTKQVRHNWRHHERASTF